MHAIIVLHKVRDVWREVDRVCVFGVGMGGVKKIRRRKNSGWRNYREGIFAAVCLRRSTGWEEKKIPTISKLIKRLQFIFV